MFRIILSFYNKLFFSIQCPGGILIYVVVRITRYHIRKIS